MSSTDTRDSSEYSSTRRRLIKTVSVAGATVAVPGFATVARGATDSGHVELETTATVPTDTSLDIRIYEDLDGDGTDDNQQFKSISDGTTTTEYDALDGTEGDAVNYWMEITLATDDGSVTPELDTMTITLPEETTTPEPTPEEQPGEAQGLSELWDNFLVFVSIVVTSSALLGLASKSMAVAAYGAYMMFAYLAITTGAPLLENILYVSLTMIMIGMAFKLWRSEMGGQP